MRKLMDDVSVQELMEMRNQGMTYDQMANALGVSRATVINHTPHAQGRTKVSDEDVMRLRDEGLTLREIGERLGCSYQCVKNHLDKQRTEMSERFRQRRERIEAKYASEPAQDPEPTQEEAPRACLITFEQSVVFGNDKRKYTIHRDEKICEITMHTEYGDVLLKPEDVQGIANECVALLRWLGDTPTLKMEVV